MGSLVIKAALAYLESHPAQVEQLVAAAFDALIQHFAKKS